VTGRQLAEHLRHLHGHDVVVLGPRRGGVPVAAEAARVLHAPLDVLAVRKLGVPGSSELAMGAIGEDSVKVTNPDIVHLAAITTVTMDTVERHEREQVTRALATIRDIQPATALIERTVIIVDDESPPARQPPRPAG
jgi:putative phosphoribosyl transferase